VATTEVDIGRLQIVETFVIAPQVVVIDEVGETLFELTWQPQRGACSIPSAAPVSDRRWSPRVRYRLPAGSCSPPESPSTSDKKFWLMPSLRHRETGTELERVLAYYRFPSLEQMTEDTYRRAIEAPMPRVDL
jgi:hypothetical protein